MYWSGYARRERGGASLLAPSAVWTGVAKAREGGCREQPASQHNQPKGPAAPAARTPPQCLEAQTPVTPRRWGTARARQAAGPAAAAGAARQAVGAGRAARQAGVAGRGAGRAAEASWAAWEAGEPSRAGSTPAAPAPAAAPPACTAPRHCRQGQGSGRAGGERGGQATPAAGGLLGRVRPRQGNCSEFSTPGGSKGDPAMRADSQAAEPKYQLANTGKEASHDSHTDREALHRT